MDRSPLARDFEATTAYPAQDLPCGCSTVAPKSLSCMRCPTLNQWLKEQGGEPDLRYLLSERQKKLQAPPKTAAQLAWASVGMG